MPRSLLLLVLSLALNLHTNSNAQDFDWVPRASYPGTGRMGAFTFVLDGKGYVAGGYNGSSAVAELWCYDPLTDTWSQRASLPSARRHGTSWTLNGRGYVVCGFGPTNQKTNTVLEYDPRTNTWATKTPLPADARYGSHGFAIGQYGYVGGGNIGSATGPFLSDMWRYNSLSDTWSAIPGIPGAERYGATSWVIDGKGYVQGGCLPSMSFTTQLWEFDPADWSWTSKTPRPGDGLSYTMAMSFLYSAVVACGKDDADYNNFQAFHYHPAANQWTAIPNYPGESGWGGASFTIGDRVFGGLGARIIPQWQYFNDFWELVKIDDVGVDEEFGNRSALRVHPSVCAEGGVHIFHEHGPQVGEAVVELVDASGRVLMRTPFVDGRYIDVSSLAAGTVAVRIVHEGRTMATGRFVVAR
jgi:N-acetylneuraminic acid mutarotase